MKDVMIDLETWGRGASALIIQIGAVYFDPTTGELGDKFAINIDPVSAFAGGGTMDPDTIRWWMQQSKEAQESLFKDPQDYCFAMGQFREFLKEADRVWSHATFDFVIIQQAFQNLGIPQLSYRQGLDIRTLMYTAKVSTSDFPREGIHHNGLDDAIHQVKYTSAALQKVRGDKTLVSKLRAIFNP